MLRLSKHTLLLALLLFAPAALAGGFDSFFVHSARNLALGGTAVGYDSSPAAVVHNPGGLGQNATPTLMLELGFATPRLESAPAPGVQALNQQRIAPMVLLAGTWSPHERVVLGMAAHPIAAAGASYRYDGPAGPTSDTMRAMLFEASPALGVMLGKGFSLGLGYRLTFMMLRRHAQADSAAQPGIELSGSGLNATGFRVGGQWAWQNGALGAERRGASVGLAYRHRVGVSVSGTEGIALGQPLEEFDVEFTLPGRATLGARGDWGRFSLVADVALALDSQNERGVVNIRLQSGAQASLPNVFHWRNSVSLRTGIELRLLDNDALALRMGFAHDPRTASLQYPTPFGPPPAALNAGTLGAGWSWGAWSFNVAYAYRRGAVEITRDDVRDAELCAFCGYPGDYRAALHTLTFDFSRSFGASP